MLRIHLPLIECSLEHEHEYFLQFLLGGDRRPLEKMILHNKNVIWKKETKKLSGDERLISEVIKVYKNNNFGIN